MAAFSYLQFGCSGIDYGIFSWAHNGNVLEQGLRCFCKLKFLEGFSGFSLSNPGLGKEFCVKLC